jgi:site-specific DNA-methyltransferase (adenine-specific)
MNQIILADNLQYLKTLPDNYIDLIYIDPPFNTKKVQKREVTKSIRKEDGTIKTGGNRYKTISVSKAGSYNDTFDDYIGFLSPRLHEAYRILKPSGSLYLHIDYRESAYVTVLLDTIFGRENHTNTCIWNFDFGFKPKNKWANKHNDILYYRKDINNYTFNYDKIPRIPYLAPAFCGKEKAAKGKIVSDTWWHSIVGTNSKEKRNYTSQKPLGLLKRIVEVSSNPGDLCLDFFAGSGSFGKTCELTERNYILIDQNPQAIDIMKNWLVNYEYIDFSTNNIV